MRLINADEHECWACVHHQNETGKCDTWCDAGEAFELREDVKNAKTVDARPVVHGDWIEEDEEFEAYMCSACKCIWCMPYEAKDSIKFCPNCGADMRKKVEE